LRADALDAVDQRLVHPIQELPGVRRKGLDVAPLAFGIHGIEHQRRFPGTADPGDNDQLVEGQVQVEILRLF